jgi:magnesium transporter
MRSSSSHEVIMAELDKALLELTIDRVREALDRDDLQDAIRMLDELKRTEDRVEVFDELDVEDQAEILPRLDPGDAAEILAELDEEDQADIAERVSDTSLSDILDEMEPDDAADVIGDLPEERQERVLSQMEEADDVRPLLIHPEDSAGGIMTTSFMMLRPMMTSEDAIQALRSWHPGDEMPYYLFVVDRERHLVGVVSLRMLITASPDTLIGSVMNTDVISVPVGTDQEECARLLKKYGFLALPVVDAESRLAGVITVDDLVDVIEEEATQDAFRLAGVSDEESVWSPIAVSLRRRVPWLAVNLGTAFLAAWVFGLFESTNAQLAWFAALPSIVAGQGGNAATQRITILVRGMATGDIDIKDAWQVILKEMWIGLLQGVLLAVLVGGGIAVWKASAAAGAVVAAAMIGNMIIAGLAGTSIPFLLKKLKLDPALASAVVVTTFTDCCGFFFTWGLATLALNYLR